MDSKRKCIYVNEVGLEAWSRNVLYRFNCVVLPTFALLDVFFDTHLWGSLADLFPRCTRRMTFVYEGRLNGIRRWYGSFRLWRA